MNSLRRLTLGCIWAVYGMNNEAIIRIAEQDAIGCIDDTNIIKLLFYGNFL